MKKELSGREQTIYDDILKASKEYKVERHIPEEVIGDIAAFIRSV